MRLEYKIGRTSKLAMKLIQHCKFILKIKRMNNSTVRK